MAARRTTRANTVDVLIAQEEKTPRNRAKKYTSHECDMLLNVCNKYHAILNINSNRDTDRQKKEATWKKVKKEFDLRCKSDGIYVSIYKHRLCSSNL